MSQNRVEIVEGRLDAFLEGAAAPGALLGDGDALAPGSSLTARKARELFEDMALSRALDAASRELKKTNKTFYTSSSAGHELNAVLGAQLRLTDPCFLHYRSGAFMMARARLLPGSMRGDFFPLHVETREPVLVRWNIPQLIASTPLPEIRLAGRLVRQ